MAAFVAVSLVSPAAAGAPPVGWYAHARAAAPQPPVIVLTLEGPEELAGPLTGAIHEALSARGVAQPDQGDLPLVELRMTMGCDGNSPTCLAEGGKTLDAGSLAYGSVAVEGSRATVRLVLLDVATASVVGEAQGAYDVEAIDTSASSIGASLVASLLGEAPPPAPSEAAAAETTDHTESAAAESSDLVWGRYEPVPTWKWAFLGTSAALLAGSLATAAATTAVIAPKGPLRDDLLAAAEDSLKDGKAANDIDPNMDGDLCAAARAEPPGEPGKVTNAAVTKICNRGDALAKVATATWITAGIFAATTIAATTLLFVHKKRGNERALRFGGSVGPGGAFLSASLRF